MIYLTNARDYNKDYSKKLLLKKKGRVKILTRPS